MFFKVYVLEKFFTNISIQNEAMLLIVCQFLKTQQNAIDQPSFLARFDLFLWLLPDFRWAGFCALIANK